MYIFSTSYLNFMLNSAASTTNTHYFDFNSRKLILLWTCVDWKDDVTRRLGRILYVCGATKKGTLKARSFDLIDEKILRPLNGSRVELFLLRGKICNDRDTVSNKRKMFQCDQFVSCRFTRTSNKLFSDSCRFSSKLVTPRKP